MLCSAQAQVLSNRLVSVSTLHKTLSSIKRSRMQLGLTYQSCSRGSNYIRYNCLSEFSRTIFYFEERERAYCGFFLTLQEPGLNFCNAVIAQHLHRRIVRNMVQILLFEAKFYFPIKCYLGPTVMNSYNG